MHKEGIRKYVLENRKMMKTSDVSNLSNTICKRLLREKIILDSNTVMVYFSVNNEVSLEKFNKKMFSLGKTIVAPKIEDEKINPYKISDLNHLKRGYAKILEPSFSDKPMKIENIDLVLVPGIAFDQYGNRIGYGKGFYDKFLKNSKAIKIAPCFENQIVENVRPDIYDVKMNKLITEKRVISFDNWVSLN